MLSIPRGDPTVPTLYSLIGALIILYGGFKGLSGRSVPNFCFTSILMAIIGLFLAYIAPPHTVTRVGLLLFCVPGLLLSSAALYFTSQGTSEKIVSESEKTKG